MLFNFLLLLHLPLTIQPTVGFGLSNNVLPFFPICHQLSPSSNSQHLNISFYFLFPSFPGLPLLLVRFSSSAKIFLGILSSSSFSRWPNQLILWTFTHFTLFYCSTKSHKFTSCPLPWYSRKSLMDNVFFYCFSQALSKFKIRSVSPGFRVEADWLKWVAPQTLSYSVGQPISNPSHDLRTPAMGDFSIYVCKTTSS